MSEITISEAGQSYDRLRRVFTKVTDSYGPDSPEARVADTKLLLAKLTFEGLGGRLAPVVNYEQELEREKAAVLAKLNGHS